MKEMVVDALRAAGVRPTMRKEFVEVPIMDNAAALAGMMDRHGVEPTAMEPLRRGLVRELAKIAALHPTHTAFVTAEGRMRSGGTETVLVPTVLRIRFKRKR